MSGAAYQFGTLSFTLEDGALRHLRCDGREVVRQIAFLVRDRDWGTIAPSLGPVAEDRQPDRLRFTIPMRFETGDGALAVTVTLDVSAGRLAMRAEGEVTGRFETNRAGFTVLHPIDHVAGAAARVTHSDGALEQGAFPKLIDPWRPFMDIAGIAYRADRLDVSFAFSGDTFEMEDQRQWGDASFKTYNRSLDLEWPYRLAQGAYPAQEVVVAWEEAAEAPADTPAQDDALPEDARFPETALVLTPAEAVALTRHPQDLALVAPQRILCHADATAGPVEEAFAAFAALQRVCPEPSYDLELICAFVEEDPEPELRAHAAAYETSGLAAASLFICPSVDRQSTPPGSDWPACPALARIHDAAARAFTDLPRGGGMATLFTELNRKRPPENGLAFVTHGLCPIVHAADDCSVMETLETIPHITRSASAICAGRAYRIGPATLAMRHNPYGSRTIPNPEGGRVCMTDDDPRHRAAFGAAYVVGLATQLARGGVSVWTPAELYGPRGILPDPGATAEAYPLVSVLRALADVAGAPVHRAEIRGGIAELEVGTTRLRANLQTTAQDGLASHEVTLSQIVPTDQRR